MSHWLARLLAPAAALALLPFAAAAQDVNAQPTYGTLNLSAGFSPDPQVRTVSAGGADMATRGGCTVHLHASAPDLDVNYQAGSLPLTITARSGADVVLLVNTPDGRWHCDDDGGGGTDASLTFASPQSGNYNIWVATYRAQSGTLPQAQVYISELGRSGGATPAGSGGVSLNWRAAPTYGTATLARAFSPDPYISTIAAGGPDAVPSLGPQCTGYVNASAPDFDINYEAGTLPLNIYARADLDITLIVNLPDGTWACSDDANGTNPHVHLSNPQSGNYNIWIGTYRPASAPLPRSVLYISELPPRW